MSDRPLFSIIIPTFNDAGNLRYCLDSIAGQTFQSFEVIVFDGGSTDRTISFLEAEDRFPFHWKSEKDEGIYDAMNKGVALAKGEYLLFLGSNDHLRTEQTLSIFEEAIRSNGAEVISGKVAYTDRENRLVPATHDAGFGPSLKWRNRLHHQGTVYHHSLFSGRTFQLRFPVLADYHFNLSIWKEVDPSFQAVKETVAVADARGRSKQFKWSLYKQEIQLKKEVLSKREMLLQYPWVMLKYLAKSIA